MDGANMADIVKMAQQVAQNIAQNSTENFDMSNGENMDMGKMISQVSESVSKMVTPDFINQMTQQNGSGSIVNDKSLNQKSKIQLEHFHSDSTKSERSVKKQTKSQIEELNDDDDNVPSLNPKTKDLHFTLNVSLEELYAGKVKKLAVRRKKLVTDGKKKSIIEEKKKIVINIEPGMFDEQIMTFNKQADEKNGYETGDIIITLCCSEHSEFERENNNLIVEKEISLYEAYNLNMTMTHLDGREFNITSSPINIFGEEIDCYRKIKNYGMPILGSDDEFGDLIIKFKPLLPENLTPEQLNMLKELFPPINTVKKNMTILETELVTESDFEFSDSDSDEYDSDESGSEETDSDESEDIEESEEESEEPIPKSKKKNKF